MFFNHCEPICASKNQTVFCQLPILHLSEKQHVGVLVWTCPELYKIISDLVRWNQSRCEALTSWQSKNLMRNFPSCLDFSVTEQCPALKDICNKTGVSNSKTDISSLDKHWNLETMYWDIVFLIFISLYILLYSYWDFQKQK